MSLTVKFRTFKSGMLQEMKEKGALPRTSHSVLSDMRVCICVVCLDLGSY